ncbi:acetolactate synthase large subunit [Kosakonia sp. BYX6]|uniref:Acetolactate synthase large subunit n=1 Tax=Kosakonia calanthes TaxID=3139408 RepID=A0ABZ3BAK9_9ENTR
MNGAESLLRTLIANDVSVCFANPGTSEMHFVAALDKVQGMRPVLGLFEGVVTGAADGYSRMLGKPACTLMHLGPGLANGVMNLHNARKASSSIVNIIGDHARYHKRYDTPLASDVESIARPVSHWVHTSNSSQTIATDGALAVQAARQAPGKIASLILPADVSWEEAVVPAQAYPVPERAKVNPELVVKAAEHIRAGKRVVFLLRGDVLQAEGLTLMQKIATQGQVRIMADTLYPRMRRGAGHVVVERIPYFPELALKSLAGTELLILVGAEPPVSFFAYPGVPNWLTPENCQIFTLAHPHEDGVAALQGLCDELGASTALIRLPTPQRIEISHDQPLNGLTIMQTVARHLPENAIICDESISEGLPYNDLLNAAAAHDFLNLAGGALGSMMAVAIGAAVACPDRKIVNLQADGSAMYILQALWTQAREMLNVTTVIYSNGGYQILRKELERTGATGENPLAESLFDIENPSLNWVALANGMGVRAISVRTPQAFEHAFVEAMHNRGPMVIECLIE